MTSYLESQRNRCWMWSSVGTSVARNLHGRDKRVCSLRCLQSLFGGSSKEAQLPLYSSLARLSWERLASGPVKQHGKRYMERFERGRWCLTPSQSNRLNPGDPWSNKCHRHNSHTPRSLFFSFVICLSRVFSSGSHYVAQSSYTATSRAFCLSLPKAGMVGMKPQIWPAEMS